MENKTNVMRILDSKKIKYEMYDYSESDALSGTEVAQFLNQNPDTVFKTLVTAGKSGNHYVFMVPVCKELDLKKAAKSAGEKSIEMIKSKELLAAYRIYTWRLYTAPIGMKKQFKTFIDISAENYEKIIFSAGKIGYQVEVAVDEFKKAVNYELKDICVM